MKIKFLLFLSLLFSSEAVYAAACKSGADVYTVNIANFTIPSDAKNGDILAETSFQNQIFCGQMVLKERHNEYSGIGLKKIPIVTGDSCPVIKTNYPGIGLAWYNDNLEGRIHCFTDNAAQLRSATSSGRYNNIIYLVKIGSISPGDFSYQYEQLFYDSYESRTPYFKVQINAKNLIEEPICKIIKKPNSDEFSFNIQQAVNQSASTGLMNYDISCSGYIEDNTKLKLSVDTAEYGVFALDNKYFATSDEGMGLSLNYQLNTDPTVIQLLPNGKVSLPIIGNKGSVGFKLTPYVKDNSGVYPLSSDIDFSLDVSLDDK